MDINQKFAIKFMEDKVKIAKAAVTQSIKMDKCGPLPVLDGILTLPRSNHVVLVVNVTLVMFGQTVMTDPDAFQKILVPTKLNSVMHRVRICSGLKQDSAILLILGAVMMKVQMDFVKTNIKRKMAKE